MSLSDYLKGLTGMRVIADTKLTGAKHGVVDGDGLHVSPAMYSLMKRADETELQKLCEQIGCLDVTNYEMRLVMVAKKIPDALKGW